MEMKYVGLCDEQGDELFEGANVELITGAVGEVVFECGCFGIAFENGIDYDALQNNMDTLTVCCGNTFLGCFNDNFLTLFEIYWNFNCDGTNLYPVKIIASEVC